MPAVDVIRAFVASGLIVTAAHRTNVDGGTRWLLVDVAVGLVGVDGCAAHEPTRAAWSRLRRFHGDAIRRCSAPGIAATV